MYIMTTLNLPLHLKMKSNIRAVVVLVFLSILSNEALKYNANIKLATFKF